MAQASPSGSSGCETEKRDHPPAGEPQVRGEGEQDDPWREARGEDRGEVREAAGEDAQEQPPVVVSLDAPLEPLERRDGIVDLDDTEPAAGDVGERDEPVDPRRVGGEDSSRARASRRSVAIVLALALGWKHDQRVGRRSVVELTERLARRGAAEEELSTSPVRSVLSALARVTLGSAPATARPIAPLRGVALERERLDDAHAAVALDATTSAASTGARTRATTGSLADRASRVSLCT